MRRPVGRPRLQGGNQANQKRLNRRVQKKCVDIVASASALLTMVMSTKAGQEAFPASHKEDSKALVLAQIGAGAIKMAQDVGAGLKKHHVKYLVDGVTDLHTFSTLTGFPVKYLKKVARCTQEPLPATFLKKTLRDYSTYSATVSYKIQEEICCRFFMAHTGVHSGARSETRQLSKGLGKLMIYFDAEYPGYARDVATLWPNVISSIRENFAKVAHSRLTILMTNILQSIDATNGPGFDEKEEFRTRFAIGTKLYQRQILEQRICRRFGLTRAKVRRLCKDLHTPCEPLLEPDEVELALLGVDTSDDIPLEPIKNDDASSTHGLQRRMARAATMFKQLREYEPTEVDITTFVEKTPSANALSADALANALPAIRPPAPKTFWGILKRSLIKFSTNVHPHECPLHDNGATYEGTCQAAAALYNALNATRLVLASEIQQHLTKAGEHTSARWNAKHAELRVRENALLKSIGAAQAQQRKYSGLQDKYKLHLKQYEACRPLLQALEKQMVPGECVLYRDFVNQYMGDGNKLANLVLVVLWRNKEGAPFKNVKFNNFCDDDLSRACDAYYVADVFDLYFGSKENGCKFFSRENIQVVFLAGDHGPHFSAIMTVFNESTFFKKYKIILICLFLCSYHAFNRCDAAGVESVRLALQQIKEGTENNLSLSYSAMINFSQYHNSFGVEFPAINRNCVEHPVFAEKLVENAQLDLRTKCEIRYSWYDNGVECREDGVVLCRDIPVMPKVDPVTGFHTLPGDGELFEVYDIRESPPGGPLCRECSKERQRPVRHGEGSCPIMSGEVKEYKDLKSNMGPYAPDSERIKGVQGNLKLKKLMLQPAGSHPCRVPACPHLHYKVYHTANRHMKSHHLLPEGHSAYYPVPPKKKSSKKRARKPTSGKPNSKSTSKQGTGAKRARVEDSDTPDETDSDDVPLLSRPAVSVAQPPGEWAEWHLNNPNGTTQEYRDAFTGYVQSLMGSMPAEVSTRPHKREKPDSSWAGTDSSWKPDHQSGAGGAHDDVPSRRSQRAKLAVDYTESNENEAELGAPPADATVLADCPCPTDASPGLGVALLAAGSGGVEVVLPAVNPADVSASAAGGAVDPPGAALYGDALPDVADASPVGSAPPPPAASVQDASASPGGRDVDRADASSEVDPANATVLTGFPCPADASPGVGVALLAAGSGGVEVVLPAVNPADVSASAADGAVDPPGAALHADAVPEAADASPGGVGVVLLPDVSAPSSPEGAGQRPSTRRVMTRPRGRSRVRRKAAPSSDGAVDPPSADSPSEVELGAPGGPGPLSVAELLDQSNRGKHVIYIATPTPSSEVPALSEKPGTAFVVVGKIRNAVWENSRVWFDTADKFASEDQHYPQTLVDAKWISEKRSSKPNWVDTQHDFVVCITDQLDKGGVLPVAASSQALDVLRLSTDPTAAEFMTRLDAVRPKSTVKAKSRR